MSDLAKPTGAHTLMLNRIEDFAHKFKILPNDCWQWTSGVGTNGYGQFSVHGVTKHAHRVAWEIVGHRFRDPWLQLDHTCENKLCVNPNHLQEVTQGQNLSYAPTPFTVNAGKDVCAAGHPYTKANTYITPMGGRSCRTCRRESVRRYKKRKKGEGIT